MAELYLVRHGQASLGTDNYDQLSEKGYRQASVLADFLSHKGIGFDNIISGDLQRHKQTILPIAQNETVTIDGDWNEFDFESVIKAYVTQYDKKSQLISKDKKGLYRLLREAMLAWSRDEIEQDMPETWSAFRQRVSDAGQRILQSDHKRVLVVSSGGAIAAFIGSIFNLSASDIINLNLQIRNASTHHFFFNKAGFQLSEFNSVAHFSSDSYQELITHS